ncbi:hypothetical protein L873DRAFT_1820458 [Choiromyces venosus 120613-1]|uniref:Uncharacterized protein n=1 Tax=Choiromyces venosus 120613-1 TaxID=1336337 RepID=A0A3N4J320_9PEZI|nr:hypothetical protein L873DRAFT_1820458 [Choiromyces venosus 120613-1]
MALVSSALVAFLGASYPGLQVFTVSDTIACSLRDILKRIVDAHIPDVVARVSSVPEMVSSTEKLLDSMLLIHYQPGTKDTSNPMQKL